MKIIFYLLALIAGMGVTLQAGVNAKLKFSLNSSILASLVSFFVGTVVLAAAYIVLTGLGMQTLLSMTSIRQTSWWMWVGGFFGAFYMFIAVVAIPKIGVGNTISLVIAGQIILAIVLDHYGVFGAVHSTNLVRVIGIVLMIAGVYIVQRF